MSSLNQSLPKQAAAVPMDTKRVSNMLRLDFTGCHSQVCVNVASGAVNCAKPQSKQTKTRGNTERPARSRFWMPAK
jgi:hypothetical protein